MTSHARLNQIALVTQRASELQGDALEAFVFVAWWRYPYARRALADTLRVSLWTLQRWCEGRMV